MNICIIYVLYGGFTMGTPACQAQLFYGDGVITPHEVVYTSHIPDCWKGHVHYVPKYRVNYRGPNIRVKRYHDIRKRYKQRTRYYKRNKYYKRHHKRYRHKKYKRIYKYRQHRH